MLILGPLGFTAPLLLWGLLALPVLWLILRAVPPAPIRRRFPGVALLLGLQDRDSQTERTPWWLLVLRSAAAAAVILGLAGPVLNPDPAPPREGPLLVVLDGGWAEAADWTARQARARAAIEAAGRAARPVALVSLGDTPQPVAFTAANDATGRLAGMTPAPHAPGGFADWVKALPDGAFETLWLADGLAHPGRDVLLAALQARGPVTVFQTPRPILALHPAGFVDGAVQLAASRLPAGAAAEVTVLARGLDPAGIERELARQVLTFAPGAARAEAALSLPPELRNRLTRFEIEGIRSAGAVSLTDDSLRRRKVALLGGGADREGLLLLSPTHYLRQALQPVADLIEGPVLADLIAAGPDVIVLADVARLAPAEAEALAAWVAKGGLLLRFAGPKLAASDLGREGDDPLLPVRLRAGGRALGGAMSWGEARALAAFAEGSPFFGLTVPADVTVTRQVLAQPDPDLANRTIASLADGTPLVTRRAVGQGQVVLFHVTANAEWSSLPLSGLFVQMMERLAVSTRPAAPEVADLAGLTFTADLVLDAFGQPQPADDLPGIPGEVLAKARPGPDLPPGLYAGADRRVALNVIAADSTLAAMQWPADVPVEGAAVREPQPLAGLLLALAALALAVDVLATLSLSGRLRAGAALVALMLLAPPEAQAQDDFARAATSEVRLAHVLTGDAAVDDRAAAGLRGLGLRLFERTTVEPGEAMAVDLERDEIAFFPFLYWPVTADQPIPSAAAYRKLNQFLATGGMILFDTRDAGAGAASPEARRLQLIASALDIPPLEPIPADHVLTRTFYLLQEFPGRLRDGALWVEAAPPDAEQAEGMPFRNLNDGVTPVVFGANDYASAWAVDDRGAPMFPVGRGTGGERQREMAIRFGVNLIMHVLTGNYKSDQFHVPALLERLGQ
jgi:hypothetical protein